MRFNIYKSYQVFDRWEQNLAIHHNDTRIPDGDFGHSLPWIVKKILGVESERKEGGGKFVEREEQ